MSENTLVAKITADAQVVVNEIKSGCQAEVESIRSETEDRISSLVESHKVSQSKKNEQIELVAVSRAKQDGHIAVQTAKRKQIDAIFNELQDELINQSPEDYVSFFTKYTQEVVDKDVEVLVVEAPAKRESETKKILDTLNLSGEVTTNDNIVAGFILRTEGGVYDVTLDRMLSGRRSELEMEVVKVVME
jgi:vacuolar-type H+-ATPase subunit E/Vma4